MTELSHEHAEAAGGVTVAAAKLAPPVVAIGMHLFGIPLSDWLILATLVYTVLQITLLLQKLWLARRARQCTKRKK